MITAKFWRPTEDSIEMRVQGHAGFAELGKDPVCAGASVLAVTLASWVGRLAQQGWLRKAPTVHVFGGNTRVTAKPKPETETAVLLFFRMAEEGFRLLAESYPEHVKLTTFDAAQAESK